MTLLSVSLSSTHSTTPVSPQGLFHPARKVREVYWRLYNNVYIGSQVGARDSQRLFAVRIELSRLCRWHNNVRLRWVHASTLLLVPLDGLSLRAACVTATPTPPQLTCPLTCAIAQPFNPPSLTALCSVPSLAECRTRWWPATRGLRTTASTRSGGTKWMCSFEPYNGGLGGGAKLYV